MPIVTKHAPGAPCWFELATSDQAAGKRFYTELLGWTANDSPMGPEEYYTMFQMNSRTTGAAYTLKPQMMEQGVPPHWAVYFATANADETADKVTQLGGTVIMPPFDVMDYGRMAVFTDLGGAVFNVWQAKAHHGVEVVNEENTVGWCELATWDAVKAREFYTGVFGWDSKGSANMATYIEFSVDGQPRGGLMPMDDQWKGIPSHWGIYFVVADCDGMATKAKSLGGAVRHGPFTAPGVGRIAVMTDPQGVNFSIISLEHKQ